MTHIIVHKQSDNYWIAYFKSNPSMWDWGHSIAQAIGNLIIKSKTIKIEEV